VATDASYRCSRAALFEVLHLKFLHCKSTPIQERQLKPQLLACMLVTLVGYTEKLLVTACCSVAGDCRGSAAWADIDQSGCVCVYAAPAFCCCCKSVCWSALPSAVSDCAVCSASLALLTASSSCYHLSHNNIAIGPAPHWSGRRSAVKACTTSGRGCCHCHIIQRLCLHMHGVELPPHWHTICILWQLAT
jgi:hypothetical protein